MAMQYRPKNNQAQAQAPRANRMTLATLSRGKEALPMRTLVYGPEGVGKTTWASEAPDPVFVCEAGGSSQLDVARFSPRTWLEVLDCIDTLATEEHGFKTLVLDTLDWAELLCWEHVCREGHEANIQAFGYGKGFDIALEQWRILMAKIERVWLRGMGVILVGHAMIKTYKNPEGEDYDRFQLKLNEKAGGFLKGWCDTVLFAREMTYAHENKKTKRVRGVSTGERVMHTSRTAVYDAKNRYDLPDTIPLDWEVFALAAARKEPASPASLRAEIERLLPTASAETQEKVTAALALEKVAGNAAQLARILNKLSAELSLQTSDNEGDNQ
jgi:hypothetical protein